MKKKFRLVCVVCVLFVCEARKIPKNFFCFEFRIVNKKKEKKKRKKKKLKFE